MLRALLVVALACLPGSTCFPEDAPDEPLARVVSIDLPGEFTADPQQGRVLWIPYTLEPGGGVPSDLRLTVRSEAGEPVPVALVDQTPPQLAGLLGAGSVAVDALGLGLGGTLLFCLRQEGQENEVCGALEMLRLLADCYERYRLAAEQSVGYGCKCKTGTIRRGAAMAPHPDLGTFSNAVGGNVLGAYDEGNVLTDAHFHSMFKFEAHFEVEISNPPARPGECPEWLWDWLVMDICTEGQEVNGTLTTTRTLSSGATRPDRTPHVGKNRRGDFTIARFSANANARFVDDGYSFPGVADRGVAACLTGSAKNYAPPNVIHWLDAPGICKGPSETVRRALPISNRIYLHSFVHGTDPTTDADDCDCYFEVKNTTIDATGAVQPSTMSAPVCR